MAPPAGTLFKAMNLQKTVFASCHPDIYCNATGSCQCKLVAYLWMLIATRKPSTLRCLKNLALFQIMENCCRHCCYSLACRSTQKPRSFHWRNGIPVIIDKAGFDTPLKMPNESGKTPVMVSLHATKVLGAGEAAILMSQNEELVSQIACFTQFDFHQNCDVEYWAQMPK